MNEREISLKPDDSSAEQRFETSFMERHIGPNLSQQQQMLAVFGMSTLKEFIDSALPQDIRASESDKPSEALGIGLCEEQAYNHLKQIMAENKLFKSYIGMGYYGTIMPAVLQRNVLENPGWYTAYTPYQSEISQGRLEALMNYQQMIMDLTGLEVANASLLDEATAAAEAMLLFRRSNTSKSNSFFVAQDVHPQTIDVLQTRASPLDIDIVVGNGQDLLENKQAFFGCLLQYPGSYGDITGVAENVQGAKKKNVPVALATDLLALMMIKSPGELGADIALGSSQRFGIPMGFGGPHAGFFATRDKLKRLIPGRIIGTSVDSRDKKVFRMTLQTREQHIRREKATSNICTAQALLANLAGFYAVYHGATGLLRIAQRVHHMTNILARGLIDSEYTFNASYFDTLVLQVNKQQSAIIKRAKSKGCNLRVIGKDRVGVSLDETTHSDDVSLLLSCLLGGKNKASVTELDKKVCAESFSGITSDQARTDSVLTHPVFNQYHTETEMLRYLKCLENKDYSLTHGMIPLGSCTMKLNPTTSMLPLSDAKVAHIHPFAPKDQSVGYVRMVEQLSDMLVAVTGFDDISLQPNAGSQGEYSGLLAIRNYQSQSNEGHRNICLIPSSAHGTNPASAVLCGLKVVIIACDDQGSMSLDDFQKKIEQHSKALSVLMLTYPSTHGVFEDKIQWICKLVHENGAQVYMDGANMNAMVGLVKPGKLGFDVAHLNLHKTFAIPHGGGGPGMGPIVVKKHLAPFVPGHQFLNGDKESLSDFTGAVSGAPYGSASILTITWLYMKMLGSIGLRRSSEVAILNANYIARRLSHHYPILYTGKNGFIAHECIIDIRDIKNQTGVSEEDIAKRLMDYGFHAPTISFPVPGTMMIEPTESESKIEIDRFIDAMVSIRQEVKQVEEGVYTLEQSPLNGAPHTVLDVIDDQWDRLYSRQVAVCPSEHQNNKFWPSCNRIDQAYGDRNFCCTLVEL